MKVTSLCTMEIFFFGVMNNNPQDQSLEGNTFMVGRSGWVDHGLALATNIIN